MNYWIRHFFGDKTFLFKLFIPGIFFINFIDIASNIANPPGYFNLWVFKITLLVFIPYIIIFIYKNFKKLNKLKKIEKEAPEFEKNREYEIRRILENDNSFTTFCFECIYFKESTKGCGRNPVFERIKEISIKNKKYCLYWEKAFLKESPDGNPENF